MLWLVIIRLFGRPQNQHALRIRDYPHPVFVRGGRSTDAVALYEVLVTREYEFSGGLDSPAFIIDGGANVGMTSLYFLNRYPGVRVIAVEPDPANFELCAMNLTPYGNRVTLIQGAIWKSAGYLNLERSSDEWSSRVRDDRPGPIRAFTLASIISSAKGKIDLLKLDIEGSEKEVFGPSAQHWLPKVRNIAIELHGEECKARFFSALEGYGYDLSMHCSWTDPAPGSPMSCYVALCRNLRPKSASIPAYYPSIASQATAIPLQ
jgi:FkbM family methyltransferase